jgi:hypothetical protein
MTAAARPGGGTFDVDVVSPQDAPVPSRSQGAIDRFDHGQVPEVVGWVPDENATLILVAEGDVEVLQVRRFRRDDAAAAVGDPGHAGLGFRVIARSRTGSVERMCVLARLPQGEVALLSGSDPTWCPAP